MGLMPEVRKYQLQVRPHWKDVWIVVWLERVASECLLEEKEVWPWERVGICRGEAQRVLFTLSPQTLGSETVLKGDQRVYGLLSVGSHVRILVDCFHIMF